MCWKLQLINNLTIHNFSQVEPSCSLHSLRNSQLEYNTQRMVYIHSLGDLSAVLMEKVSQACTLKIILTTLPITILPFYQFNAFTNIVLWRKLKITLEKPERISNFFSFCFHHPAASSVNEGKATKHFI